MFKNHVVIKDIKGLKNKILIKVQSDILVSPKNREEYNECLKIVDEFKNNECKGRLHHHIWTWHIPVRSNSIVRIIYQE